MGEFSESSDRPAFTEARGAFSGYSLDREPPPRYGVLSPDAVQYAIPKPGGGSLEVGGSPEVEGIPTVSRQTVVSFRSYSDVPPAPDVVAFPRKSVHDAKDQCVVAPVDVPTESYVDTIGDLGEVALDLDPTIAITRYTIKAIIDELERPDEEKKPKP